jgi:hypothetical protein
VLTALVLPGPTRFTAGLAATQPLRCFFVGLLTLALAPVVIVLLTIVTAGVGGLVVPVLIPALVALGFFGRTAVFAALGGGLTRLAGPGLLAHPAAATAVGTGLVYLGYMLPVVGGALFVLLFPFALGAGVLALVAAFRRERREAQPALTPPGPSPAPAARPSGPPPAAASGFAAGLGGAPAFAPAPEPVPATPEPAPATVPLPPPPAPAPPPAFDSAELLSQPRAGFWPRLGAAAIDLAAVAVLHGILPGPSRLFWLLLAAYHVGFWVWRGTTPGGIILGLRLIRTDGRPVTWQVALVRALAALISLLPAGLGFLWVIWDDERQSWHDRIAGTTLVKTRRPQPLV